MGRDGKSMESAGGVCREEVGGRGRERRRGRMRVWVVRRGGGGGGGASKDRRAVYCLWIPFHDRLGSSINYVRIFTCYLDSLSPFLHAIRNGNV